MVVRSPKFSSEWVFFQLILITTKNKKFVVEILNIHLGALVIATRLETNMSLCESGVLCFDCWPIDGFD